MSTENLTRNTTGDSAVLRAQVIRPPFFLPVRPPSAAIRTIGQPTGQPTIDYQRRRVHSKGRSW